MKKSDPDKTQHRKMMKERDLERLLNQDALRGFKAITAYLVRYPRHIRKRIVKAVGVIYE